MTTVVASHTGDLDSSTATELHRINHQHKYDWNDHCTVVASHTGDLDSVPNRDRLSLLNML